MKKPATSLKLTREGNMFTIFATQITLMCCTGSRGTKSSSIGSHKMVLWCYNTCMVCVMLLLFIQKLSNFFAKISTSQPSKPPEVMVDFSLDRTKQCWEEGSYLAIPASDKLRVIGPIHYQHQWLVLIRKDISLFNVKQ